MPNPDLARIEPVADLRSVWPREAQDFTLWLADNIDRLGEILGMELDLQETEASVGGYSLDILAADLNTGRPVVIENQLETTNHTHLGQSLTYAAGYDAAAVVWVAKEFRDEHRQALDWLNHCTDQNTRFFGVVIELWRIDESRPAPHFRVVAYPNNWSKGNSGSNRSNLETSERGEKYREFFQSMIDVLREKHRFTNAKEAQPRNYRRFSSGFRGIHYAASISQGKVAVQLHLDREDMAWNQGLLARLERCKEGLEYQIGNALDWQQVEGRRACHISLYRPGAIDDDPATLQETQEWMIEQLLKFKGVFGPHLAEMVNTPGQIAGAIQE